MHDLVNQDEDIALLVSAVIFLFIGPTIIVVLRGGEELGDFVLLNALAFIMPVTLLALWPIAFFWPKRQEDPPGQGLRRSPCSYPMQSRMDGGVRLIRSRRLTD
jgi:hypothetical protein